MKRVIFYKQRKDISILLETARKSAHVCMCLVVYRKNGCSGVRVNGVMLPGNSSAFAER